MAMIHPQVVALQPTVVAHTMVSPRSGQWVSGMFSCCEDMSICCFGFWCPCFLACQVSADHGEGLCLPLVDTVLSGVVPSISMALRTSIRERHGIQGSICDDCCVVTCCSTCAYCQMARELKERKHRHLSVVTSTTVVTNPPLYAPQYPGAPGHAQPLMTA